jgi:hypothetical protein
VPVSLTRRRDSSIEKTYEYRATPLARVRGDAEFSVDEAIDILIAPICYRILL